MSQLQSAFLIDKEYTGPLQVEGYVRKQSKQPDQIDKSIYFKIDLENKQIERAPSKLDFNKYHKIVLFSEILQIHSATQENQKSWGYYITFEYKTKMKRQLTLILETAQLYQLFTFALSSIYDSARKEHLLINQQQKQIPSNQNEYLSQQNISFTTSDPAKLTIKRRVDIYKKRNQSASSTRQNNQILNKTCNLDEEPGKRQMIDNPYSQEISKKSSENSKKSQEIVLDQYQNHFFGRCVNRVIKTVINPEVSKVLQENQENKNVIKPKNDKSIVETNGQNANKNSQTEVARKNFRYSNQNYGNDDQQSQKNYNQNVSQTVPQTSIHTKRPSIVTERDQGNQNQYNSIATPHNQTISTITPRHSSISARSRKYKRQKNISFDSGNPSQTLNFYAESNKKGNIVDNQIDKLNKTTLTCNYYEPNIYIKKQEYEIQNNSQFEQIQSKDQDFYPSFAKNYSKNQRVTTMNEKDQSEWSLASIKSPKIKPDDNKKESTTQFFPPEQKKIKIIRKRSSKLSNTIEDEIETEQQNQLTALSNQNSSSLKSNHLLSNLSNFKLKTENNKEQNQEYIQDYKEEANTKNKNVNQQEQSNIILEEQLETKIDTQKNQLSKQDTFNAHKEQQKQNNNKLQQENIQQMQHSSLLRPNSSQNSNQNSCSPKKYGNIPKPQSGQKSVQKNVELLKCNNINDQDTQMKEQKPQINAYFKQLYDFNLNKEMQDDDLNEIENIDIDSYKIILQKEPKNIEDDNLFMSKISKDSKNIEMNTDQEIKKLDIDVENNKILIQDKPKSLSPLKNKTNKIQQQIINPKQEISSYQFNQQINDNSFPQNKNLSNNQKSQFTKVLEQNQIENSPKNQHLKKNSNKQDSNEKNTKNIENQNQQELIPIKQQIQQQVQDKFIDHNTQKLQQNKAYIKETEQNAPTIEYHDFDNSFDKDDVEIEIFSQIKKVDEIIKIIEEKTSSVLQNNKEPEQEKCSLQQLQNKSDEINQIDNIDDIENQLQQNNSQQYTEQDQPIESNRSGTQTKNNDQNYDWNCMKDPNYKPTTSPLKERLYMVEEETSQQNHNQKTNENDNKQSELMIVMVNKNQNIHHKKKEKPILRQRDVFSDEFWNPVTNPRNYKVTNQPPNLNETKQNNKQVLVPVKVTCQNDDLDPKDGDKQQKQQAQKNDNKVINDQYKNENKNIQNQSQNISYQNTNLFDEVKDFFKIQVRGNMQKQQQLQQQQQQHFDNNSQNQKDVKANNNQIQIQNNYDDWDDYY
ncbi:hypothetical protein TTHERM_00732860 (macronuclear) [Tetrahymena thermophila SB210]|uniref:Uncharacterized protein n=1 Tax=Tetrahymena thermophila (strain SB210) TaxID=312017 RepID=Q245C5_TETTS|nr:hypothetical protein TTHERM_00732860 [Tetrahymena thermophila SB210]EAS03439.2 hypothetical protein TTHERM_00732860 [Tetrahymena thermophila SB210]|eukprot:XP_001023684.2 hypothetical protein TTHERM_00732860 [Tetrahymena thermophila SB210]